LRPLACRFDDTNLALDGPVARHGGIRKRLTLSDEMRQELAGHRPRVAARQPQQILHRLAPWVWLTPFKMSIRAPTLPPRDAQTLRTDRQRSA